MGQYSVGEALNQLLEKSHWKARIYELRIRQEWEQAAGKTIAKYTRNITLYQKTLTIYTDIGPLKQELHLGKSQLQQQINDYFGDTVVEQIVIK
jgi:predicted nucleic acid-binding Zn ribbon protein